jgi:hypothetical protein
LAGSGWGRRGPQGPNAAKAPVAPGAFNGRVNPKIRKRQRVTAIRIVPAPARADEDPTQADEALRRSREADRRNGGGR